MRRLLGAGLTAILLLFGLYNLWECREEGATRREQQLAFVADIERLDPKPNELYIAWGSKFPFEYITPLTTPTYLKQMAILPLGLELHTPHVNETMDRFGVSNLYSALFSRRDIYLISNQAKNALYVAYVKEKHGVDVRFDIRFIGKTFTVYQVVRI